MNNKFDNASSVTEQVKKDNPRIEKLSEVERGLTKREHEKLKRKKGHERRQKEKDFKLRCRKAFTSILLGLFTVVIIVMTVCIGDLFYKYFRDIISDPISREQAAKWIWQTGLISAVSIAIGKFILQSKE